MSIQKDARAVALLRARFIDENGIDATRSFRRMQDRDIPLPAPEAYGGSDPDGLRIRDLFNPIHRKVR